MIRILREEVHIGELWHSAYEMKARIGSLLLILLMMSASHAQQRMNYGETPWGPIDYVWMDLSPAKCRAVTSQKSQFRACPPVAGYQLLYGGTEASPQIIIVSPDRKRHVLPYWDLKAGNFISLNRGVSWKVVRRPTGQIILLALMLQAEIKPDEFTRFRGPYTIVAKLTPSEVCVVGRVPTNSTSAADVEAVSTSALNKKCVGLEDVGEKDWLGVVYGLTGEGRYEDAKSVIKEIGSPGARTGAYTHIARAQALTGDLVAARTTLLLGLDEVLNQKEWSSYSDPYGGKAQEATRDANLISVLSAMAAVGLDTEVNNNLKFVSDSYLPATLLWIGKAQGLSRPTEGRGDRAAATATFNRAIEIELRRADTTMADSNLVNIVRAQAEIGLISEARQTVLLIKAPSGRQAAEGAIAWETEKPDL